MCGNLVPVIVELLRSVPALSSEEPGAIWVDEFHVLRFVADGEILGRNLSLLCQAVFLFFGEYLRCGRSWEQ